MIDSFPPFLRRLRLTLLLVLFLALGVAAFGFFTGTTRAQKSDEFIVGNIRVIDGDSFEVAGTKIRLHGVDAPEHDQICQTDKGAGWACGVWTTRVVSDRYSGAVARCTVIELDRYGRTVARCDALGEDVGAWLVREGMAFAYVKYSNDYAKTERDAAAADRGLHAARLQNPAEHRKNRKLSQSPPDGKCRIKGNISADGSQIYHLPGQIFYENTLINKAKGERWFCSADAARAAGWRASLQ